MGYRLTYDGKWDDKWFRSLGPLRKLVFLFLCDKCDLAGFYEIDFEDMVFRIKAEEEHILGATKGLDRGLVAPDGIHDGAIVWIKKFLIHQKNLPLKPENNAHKHIIECFKRRGEFGRECLKNLGANEGLLSPPGKGKGKGKGKEGESEGEEFEKFWDIYHQITMKKKEDKEGAIKKWKQLTKKERQSAMLNIKFYFDSLDDPRYCKMARTYLDNKCFNNEFDAPSQKPQPGIR